MYPGHKVVFNLDGTQALKTQVQNGAYADVFISASNSYTTELTKGGYFVDGTVKPLTSNYVIVILPAKNPANIKSLADLAKPGVKIAMGDKSVPVGTATIASLPTLQNRPTGQDWNTSVFKNVVTYETSEPGVATKVALGEVDAGFVYESTSTRSQTTPIPGHHHPEEGQLSPDLHHRCHETVHEQGRSNRFRELHALHRRPAGPQGLRLQAPLIFFFYISQSFILY